MCQSFPNTPTEVNVGTQVFALSFTELSAAIVDTDSLSSDIEMTLWKNTTSSALVSYFLNLLWV